MLTLWLLAESDIPILPRLRITKTQTCSRKIAPVLLTPVFDHTSSLVIYSLGRMRGVLSLLDDSDLRNYNGRLRLPGFIKFDVEIITMEYAIDVPSREVMQTIDSHLCNLGGGEDFQVLHLADEFADRLAVNLPKVRQFHVCYQQLPFG